MIKLNYSIITAFFVIITFNVSLAQKYIHDFAPEMGNWKNLYEMEYKTPITERIDKIHQEPLYWTWINAAWETMMIKQGIIPEKDISKFTGSIIEMWEGNIKGYNSTQGLNRYLQKEYGKEVSGNANIARTYPPLRQMFPTRYELMKLISLLHDFQEALLDVAEQNKETIMPGYTHIRHAQPTTFGHWLLSVYDPINRSMDILEKSYYLMSLNELGMGSMSGTSFPIDRKMVDDYLGMEMLENTNDAAAYADGYVTLVSGLTNISAIMSRFALELNFWSGPEYNFVYFTFGGVSFMMPNKLDNQPWLERTRVYAAEMLGKLTEIAAMGMRAPQGDMHEFLHMGAARDAIRISHLYMHLWPKYIKELHTNKERMLNSMNGSYIASTELANVMVRNHKIDYRTAHEIVYDFVQECKDKNIPRQEADSSLLDKVAMSVIGKKINMTQGELQLALDPVNFVNVHTSQGGVAPKEVQRMINQRRNDLEKARNRLLQKIEKLENAKEKLFSDVKELHENAK